MSLPRIILFCISFLSVVGQVRAQGMGFVPSDPDGCSPFSFSLIDTSSSAAQVSRWDWVLYNANDTVSLSSFTPTANLTLVNAGLYNVLLTTTDSASVERSLLLVDLVTVNPVPIISFSKDTNRGCRPQEICFVNNSQAACNSLQQCIVDYGDGVVDTSCSTAFCHTYLNSGLFQVSYVVTNDCGCVSVANNVDTILVEGPPVPDFVSTNRTACSSSLTTSMTNLTPNQPGLSWSWDLDGDLSTIESNAYNPSWTFPVGSWNVSLIVQTSLGCSDTFTRKNYVQVGQLDMGFTISKPTGCVGEFIFLTDTTPGNIVDRFWTITRAPSSTFGGGQVYGQFFTSPGVYDIELVVTHSNGCKDTLKRPAALEVFEAEQIQIAPADSWDCKDLSDVRWFLDTADMAGFSWNWKAPRANTDSIVDTGTGPVIDFGMPLSVFDTVDLEVYSVDLNGCLDTLDLDNFFWYDPIEMQLLEIVDGCVPQTDTVIISVSSTDPIVSITWDVFDDGTIDYTGDTAIVYSDSTLNCDPARIVVRTQRGCELNELENISCVGDTPDFCPFVLLPEFCQADSFVFYEDSCPQATHVVWQWGDGQSDSTQPEPGNRYKHSYPDTCGWFQPIAQPYWYGCPGDTVRADSVDVICPDAKFELVLDCSNPTSRFFDNQTLTNGGTDSFGYFWRIMDSVFTGIDSFWIFDTVYDFGMTGNFIIELEAHNFTRNCSSTILQSPLVTVPDALADSNYSPVCLPNDLLIANRSPHPAQTSWYIDAIDPLNLIGGLNPLVYQSPPGVFDIWLVNTDENGCRDSLLIPDVVVIELDPAFEVDTTFACAPHDFQFTNQSSFQNTQVISWKWDFGDPVIAADTSNSPGPLVNYTYNRPGNYSVWLEMTDTSGCVRREEKFFYLQYNAPDGSFVCDTLSCTGEAIRFLNTSNDRNLVEEWYFDDPAGTTAGKIDSFFLTYPLEGTYEPMLLLRDPDGCVDTNRVRVRIIDPVAGFTADTTFLSCQGVLDFYDSSVGASWWDWLIFSDEDTLSSISRDPSGFLTTGQYSVRQVVGSLPGCSDTLFSQNYVEVAGPYLDFQFAGDGGCSPLELELVIETANIDTVVYVSGDGRRSDFVLQQRGTLANPFFDTLRISYQNPGVFVPFLSSPQQGLCPGVGHPLDTIFIEELDRLILDSAHLCEGGLIRLEDRTTSDPVQTIAREWKLNGQAQGVNSVLNLPVNNAGSLEVVLVQSLSYCTDSTVFRYEVPPFVQAAIIADTAVQCAGEELDARRDFIGLFGLADVRWEYEGDFAGSGDSVNVRLQAGNAQVLNLRLTDTLGCSDSAQLLLDVLAVERSDTSFDIHRCFADSFAIRLPPPQSRIAGIEGSLLWLSTSDSAYLQAISNGYVELVNSLGNCRYRDIRYEVYVADTLSAELNAFPDQLLEGDLADLSAVVFGVYDSLRWFPDATLECPDCPNTQIRPQAGEQIGLEVYSSVGERLCVQSFFLDLEVNDQCNGEQVFLPMAFSPNGDGQNDRFYVRGTGLEEVLEFHIYDRWGKLLFQVGPHTANDDRFGWDGYSMGGVPCAPGIYVYTARTRCTNGDEVQKSGNLTLLR